MPAAFTSPLAEAVAPDLLERFTRYVQIDTQSRGRPRALAEHAGAARPLRVSWSRSCTRSASTDAELDEHGYVYATLPATVPDSLVIGLIAHVDTSPDAPGAGVAPIVWSDYDGGVIKLPSGGTRLDPATMPELADKRGHDIVTASGDTLLGADDKAGVAAIMAAVAYLAAHPELPRPTLRIAFTPDEEIGQGATLFDIPRFGARCAYTIDGSDARRAAGRVVQRDRGADHDHGRRRSPRLGEGQARQRAARRRADRRGAAERPADAGDHLWPRGLHPPGDVPRAPPTRRGAFDRARLRRGAARVARRAAASDAERVVAEHPGAELDFERDPPVPQHARVHRARSRRSWRPPRRRSRAEGIEPMRKPIRGGTDGSRLSEMGLPTPNIFDGGYEYHSVREWASLQDMAASAAVHRAARGGLVTPLKILTVVGNRPQFIKAAAVSPRLRALGRGAARAHGPALRR